MKHSIGKLMLCHVKWLAVLVVATMAATVAHAQRNSPVGSWDVVASGGGQAALMILEFGADNTVSGYALFSGVQKKAPKDNGRGVPASRDGSDGASTNAQTKRTNWFGFTPISGTWMMDLKGNTVGFYTFIGAVGGEEVVNSVSFRGKAQANKRLTLVASTTYGKVAFRGIPLRTVTPKGGGTFDASGWYGARKIKNVVDQEFFSLALSEVPNVYIIEGSGPTYEYPYEGGSVAMISRQKKIGFAIQERTGTNDVLRASIGNFNNGKKTSAVTKGVIQASDSYFEFKAVRFE
ncbi:MAG TPA: hypothetical protein VEH04_03205 [Verrucomicrobiae bacterium]|nr:hypothetical protein [Verrucomicrobiae bacterium]